LQSDRNDPVEAYAAKPDLPVVYERNIFPPVSAGALPLGGHVFRAFRGKILRSLKVVELPLPQTGTYSTPHEGVKERTSIADAPARCGSDSNRDALQMKVERGRSTV